jgi:glycyl-tRNA synthetase beta chain
MDTDAAQSLAAANKRIGNILRKSDYDFSTNFDKDHVVLSQEGRLFEEVRELEIRLPGILDGQGYLPALEQLSLLRDPVDAFFDAVMVMDEDTAKRNNRLALLARLKALFDQIADLSVLA